MTDQSTEARLRELLAKATTSFDGVPRQHGYWLDGVQRARIEIVNALPSLLDERAALRCRIEELQGERDKLLEGRETFLADNAALRERIEELEGTTLNGEQANG